MPIPVGQQCRGRQQIGIELPGFIATNALHHSSSGARLSVGPDERWHVPCPISIALELLGDARSLLIVRDLMFKGRHGFNEFPAGAERIATNILADRLRRLDEAGLSEARADRAVRRRDLYRPTRMGIDLAPALVELVVWAASHEVTDAPPDVVRQMRENRRAFLAGVLRQWESEGAEG